jgi:hypothetical protein
MRVLLFAGLLAAAAAAAPAAPPAPDYGVPPDKAAARMTLPEGFRAHLVAGEPQLVKPIAMTTDDRGRSLTNSSHRLCWG